MKLVDIPPVWLVGFVILAWFLGRLWPDLTIDIQWQGAVAIVLFWVGLILMGLAVWEMTRARTTFVPRRQPTSLVKSGIFSMSRNPIYLGDALVLTGVIIWFGAIVAAPLLPAFVWTITRRFILSEEAALQANFGPEFERWSQKTRRWL